MLALLDFTSSALYMSHPPESQVSPSGGLGLLVNMLVLYLIDLMDSP